MNEFFEQIQHSDSMCKMPGPSLPNLADWCKTMLEVAVPMHCNHICLKLSKNVWSFYLPNLWDLIQNLYIYGKLL